MAPDERRPSVNKTAYSLQLHKSAWETETYGDRSSQLRPHVTKYAGAYLPKRGLLNFRGKLSAIWQSLRLPPRLLLQNSELAWPVCLPTGADDRMHNVNVAELDADGRWRASLRKLRKETTVQAFTMLRVREDSDAPSPAAPRSSNIDHQGHERPARGGATSAHGNTMANDMMEARLM